MMPSPLVRKVDCVSLPVNDLARAMEFYCDRLGHEMIWRMPNAVGLRLPESDTEIVLHTDPRPPAAELLVEAVPAAVKRIVAAGGSVVKQPLEIPIGMYAVVADPWGNHLVLLDMSKGPLQTDAQGNVIDR